jgi:MinD superfamily P-loop ATPase
MVVDEVNKAACEGCAVCALVCPNSACFNAQERSGKTYALQRRRCCFFNGTTKHRQRQFGVLVTEVKKNMQKQSHKAILLS